MSLEYVNIGLALLKHNSPGTWFLAATLLIDVIYWVSIFFFVCSGGECLRDVGLRVTPSAVPRGEPATLECMYDLQGKKLDSVKWYRGSHEFYRYTPTEQPHTKVFPIQGLHVDVSYLGISSIPPNKKIHQLRRAFPENPPTTKCLS